MASFVSDRLEEVARFLGKSLEEAGLAAALIGGHAVNYWDTPRFTEDFDFTVAADSGGMEHLIKQLEGAGWVIEIDQNRAASSGPDFVRMRNPLTRDMLDIQAAKTPYQELVVQRAVREPGDAFAVATREDLIVLKLIAWRMIDQQDVLRLSQYNIDWEYVEHWCEVWEVTDRLENLRRAITEDQQSL